MRVDGIADDVPQRLTVGHGNHGTRPSGGVGLPGDPLTDVPQYQSFFGTTYQPTLLALSEPVGCHKAINRS
jgi:hypothetical protein